MTVQTARFQLLDLQLGGRLEETLRSLYAETGTWEGVSRRLFADHGKEVSGQTLRLWAVQLGIEPKRTAAAS
jgi:hypothetical protein